MLSPASAFRHRGQSGTVLYPKKGVCADPVDKGAILGEGGGNPIVVS
jgi:hypothetical protein